MSLNKPNYNMLGKDIHDLIDGHTAQLAENVTVYVEHYKKQGNESDDTSRVQRAIDVAPEFSTIEFDPKVTYYLTHLTMNKSLNINLNGATFIIDPSTDADSSGHLTKGHPTFYFKGSTGSSYPIQTPGDFSTSITMSSSADASNFSVGDYIIIQDQTPIPMWDNSATASTGYSEINIITAISNGVLTLSRPTEWAYSTSPTIQKMTPLMSPKVYGASKITEVDPGYVYSGGLTGYAPHPVHFEYCVCPEIHDCHFDKWQLHATNFHYCVFPIMERCSGKDPFRTSDGGSGYLMRFERCLGGTTRKCMSNKVRHTVDFVMSYDCLSDDNLAINPQNVSFYWHGNSSKRCYSTNDKVNGGALHGWAIGNSVFAGDYDAKIVNPVYKGSNIGIVVQAVSQRVEIVNPSVYTTGSDGVLISSGAGEVDVFGGTINGPTRTIMVRPQMAYGDTTGVKTGRVVFHGTKIRGGGQIRLRDDCSFEFIDPDIEINNAINIFAWEGINGQPPIDFVVKGGDIRGSYSMAFSITTAPTRRYEVSQTYSQGYTSKGANLIGANNLRFTDNDFPDENSYNIYGTDAPNGLFKGNRPATTWG